MSGNMSLDRAWRLLGQDSSEIYSRILDKPKGERVEALRCEYLYAKKYAKVLMAKHHPDRGGDPTKFRLIHEALSVIEFHTNEYERKYEEKRRSVEEAAERRGVFIKVDR